MNTLDQLLLSNEFKSFLENTEIKFTHRNRENVSMNDLFVFPDLKIIKDSLKDFSSSISSENLWNYAHRILVLGGEQSGKTTLAKRLFLDAFSHGFSPLLIQGSNIGQGQSKLEDQIKLIARESYNITQEEFLKRENLICIIDDISANKLNTKTRKKLISDINNTFSHSIIIAEESFRLVTPDFPELDDYKKMEILPFGHVLRAKLIDKWVELEITEETYEQEIWAKTDEIRLHVDTLVHKNVVPAKPFHLLILLQSFETTVKQSLELTAYGHYYQHLIYQALERVHVKPDEYEKYLNVLSELGGAILQSSSESINEDDFFKEYSKKFLLAAPVNQEKIINNLVNSGILQRSENELKFYYRYSFYFFAAKKLADSLHKGEDSKNKIRSLVTMLHLEKASNIVLFLTHHSKDPWILDEILISVMDIFSNEEEVTLESDSLSFIQNFIKEIPELVLENRDAREERLKNDIQKDQLDNQEDQSHSKEQNHKIDDNEKLSEFIVKVNKVFRAIEVCGQILRNRIGSMERNSLEFIYEESLSVSLRFLSVFLTFSEYVQQESIRKIQKIVDQHPNRPNSKVIRDIESFYLAINYTVILAMLYKISSSLGSSKGREIYVKLTQVIGTPASKLIQEIIELQFEKKLDFTKIKSLHNEFSQQNNFICDRLLKHIIVHHCHMHGIPFKDRQRLASLLNIPLGAQQSMMIAQKRDR
jgi:hypothetical protein